MTYKVRTLYMLQRTIAILVQRKVKFVKVKKNCVLQIRINFHRMPFAKRQCLCDSSSVLCFCWLFSMIFVVGVHYSVRLVVVVVVVVVAVHNSAHSLHHILLPPPCCSWPHFTHYNKMPKKNIWTGAHLRCCKYAMTSATNR